VQQSKPVAGRPRRSGIAAPAGRLVPAVLLAAAACSATAAPAHRPPGGTTAITRSAVTDVSARCAGRNAEVEEATAAPAFVYLAWIGCRGIGFARSVDGGRGFGQPVRVPGSAGLSWDPAVAVAPDGTVYISYMHASGGFSYPVVAEARPGSSALRVVSVLRPPARHSFGDRDFIAAGRSGRLYLTWDYGPSAAPVAVRCHRGGSCAFTAGDLNAVIQRSVDGGRSWSPITPLGPGFPRNGGDMAPVLVQPDGRVDVLYLGHRVGRPPADILRPGHEYFTSSATGAAWPRQPAELGAAAGPVALRDWWIDGDLGIDAAGNLYAAWDTQRADGDVGWLAVSRDGGRTWSAPVRVTPDRDRAPHIVEVAGGPAGVAYAGWQTSAPAQGYATYLRPFSVSHGWLGPPVRVSGPFGKKSIWPGDTFGIAVLPGHAGTRVALSWGSATGTNTRPAIYATVIGFPAPYHRALTSDPSAGVAAAAEPPLTRTRAIRRPSSWVTTSLRPLACTASPSPGRWPSAAST
jgi:hypothetical protein